MAVKQEPFDVGDTVPVEIDFTDVSDVLQNPTSVAAFVKDPSGNVADVTVSLAHPSAGKYLLSVTFDEPGVWVLRGEGTGTIPLVRERRISVRTPDIP